MTLITSTRTGRIRDKTGIQFHRKKTPMATRNVMEPSNKTESQSISRLLDQYGGGPIQIAGSDNGLYERHLLFDNVIDMARADARDRFEAFARSGRDVLSQRWTLTENSGPC